MEQQDLWMSRARCRGLKIFYDVNEMIDGVAGDLYIMPKWSKRPRADGFVHLRIDECTQDVVPELLREAWDGFLSADPGYYIPRWVKQHLKDYEDASHRKLKD